MSIGSSIIRVDIIGDASKLVSATGKAETSVGGMVKGIGGALAAAGIADKLFDLGQEAIALNDTMEDSFADIRRTIANPVLAEAVVGLADDFERISRADSSELLAQVARLVSAQGLTITAEQFADIVASADALSQLNPNLSTSDAIDAILKAVNDPEGLRALNKLGIYISEADLAAQGWTESSSDAEKKSAALRAIMLKLDPAVQAVADSVNDLDQKQRIVNKKWEDFLTKQGPMLEDLFSRLQDAVVGLAGFLGSVAGALDAVWTAFKNTAKGVIAEVGKMADKIRRWFTIDIPSWISNATIDIRNFIGKIGDAIRKLKEMLGLERQSGSGTSGGPFSVTGTSTYATSAGGGALPAGVTINISGDPVTIERTVIRALRTYSRRNGGLAGLA